MGNKAAFAKALGFEDWDALMEASPVQSDEGVYTWFITALPDGRWAVWDDAELEIDRVEIYLTRETAEKAFAAAWEEAHHGEE